MFSIGLDRRFKFKEYYCVSMDDEGYRKAFYWRVPLKGYEVEEVVEGGEGRYYVNVKEYKWVCALCPNLHGYDRYE
jgi:CTP-dependent riboflavin kinase